MARKYEMVAAAAGLLVSLAAPSASHAFCRNMSCTLGEAERVRNGGEACARDANQCVTDGQPQHWASACIDYAVQVDGSVKLGLDADEFQKIVAEAFSAWSTVACPQGGSPRFKARFQGYVGCNRHEFVCGDASKNVNAIMFHDRGWPGPAGVLGVTTPSGGIGSGLVVDADLELDSQDYAFDVDGSGKGFYRLKDVLTHEVGHFLGLDHSNVSGALMSLDYATLALSHELLTPDDIAAICTVYPPGAPLDCAAPSAPAYDACQLKPGEHEPCELASTTHESKGCSVGGSSGAGGKLALLPLFASLIWLRRRHLR
jgi:hypothetical protein